MSNFQLPGRAVPVWIATTPETNFEPLSGKLSTDVAVIGGGIVGITTALFLKQAGARIALIEAGRVSKGVSGHTTAKITSLHTLIYDHLITHFGAERARQYADSNQAAIDRVESLVTEHSISCDFSRKPFTTYAQTDAVLRKVEAEMKAVTELGLPATFAMAAEMPFSTLGAVTFTNQAQFHPRKYLLALADLVDGDGSRIFEMTRALDIEEGNPCRVTTSKGEVTARNVVIATNFPIHDRPGFYFARLSPTRSYVLAARIRQPFPDAMFVSAEEEGYSFRAQPAEGGEIIIVGGGHHKTGHGGDTVQQYSALEEYVRKVYDSPKIEYRWSTQDTVTIDHVPYIGRSTSGSRHIFLATGFAQWGMSSGTLAGMILSDLIQGRGNPWAPVYDPTRFKADTSAAKQLISANLEVAKDFMSGLFGRPAARLDDVRPGEAGVVSDDGKTGVYRDEQGNIHAVDPKCTHLGCIVRWNNAEHSWDCPCHGSRFQPSGEIIHAPAVRDLPRKETGSR
ncbi:MAG: FAD-dependent oxidoreductase [Dehalococcoidia bacterium]|nr:FAD-dependent oxidoreductase [Dehalococcoidia bacterium]